MPAFFPARIRWVKRLALKIPDPIPVWGGPIFLGLNSLIFSREKWKWYLKILFRGFGVNIYELPVWVKGHTFFQTGKMGIGGSSVTEAA